MVEEENYSKGEEMVVVVVRNNGTRNGWMDRWMHRCRLEGKSARSLAHYSHSPTTHSLAAAARRREAFPRRRLVLAAAAALCRPLVALILSPSPISS